jgi:hypothetical protein
MSVRAIEFGLIAKLLSLLNPESMYEIQGTEMGRMVAESVSTEAE